LPSAVFEMSSLFFELLTETGRNAYVRFLIEDGEDEKKMFLWAEDFFSFFYAFFNLFCDVPCDLIKCVDDATV
jgi:hypothetical protein